MVNIDHNTISGDNNIVGNNNKIVNNSDFQTIADKAKLDRLVHEFKDDTSKKKNWFFNMNKLLILKPNIAGIGVNINFLINRLGKWGKR